MFKIGDKVKFVGVTPKILMSRIGVVIEVQSPKYEFPYRIQFDCGHCLPVLKWEVEKVVTKGQQLLLFEL